MRIVDADGIETVLHSHNDGTGSVSFETRQNVAPILDVTKRRHTEGLHGSGEMRHAASFPRVLVDKYCNDHNITFQEWMTNKEHVRRMLNSPDLSGFRIWPGRV